MIESPEHNLEKSPLGVSLRNDSAHSKLAKATTCSFSLGRATIQHPPPFGKEKAGHTRLGVPLNFRLCCSNGLAPLVALLEPKQYEHANSAMYQWQIKRINGALSKDKLRWKKLSARRTWSLAHANRSTVFPRLAARQKACRRPSNTDSAQFRRSKTVS